MSKSGVDDFVAALSRKFDVPATTQQVNILDADPTEMFKLNGRGVTLVVTPVPDERCNPKAPSHISYKQKEYRVDLVYRVQSVSERDAAKRRLLEAAKEVGQPISIFREC